MQMYINKNGQQLGPFDEAKVVEMLRNGQILPTDFGIKQGQQQWQKLEILFPQSNQTPIAPSFPIYQPNNQFNNQPLPKKSSGSKVILFFLLGIGGLFLVGIIGIVGLFLFNKSKKSAEFPNLANSNSISNSNLPKSTPTPDYAWLESKAAEFSKLKPTLKLDGKPSLKGKIAIIEQYDRSNDYSAHAKGISEVTDYGLTKEKLPANIGELDTIVQIICGKGREVGKFGPLSAYVPAYANSCKVSIIDYKQSIITFQKTIENATRPKTISVTKDQYEYVLSMPTEEIQKFVKSIPIV